jgi:hypothetical protein
MQPMRATLPSSSRARLPVAALALTLLVAGCGGSSSGDKANTIRSTPTQTAPPTTSTTPRTPPPSTAGTTQETPPPTQTGGNTGGTPSGDGSGGTGGVYPGQPAPNPKQSPGERFRQYCASHPRSCGD